LTPSEPPHHTPGDPGTPGAPGDPATRFMQLFVANQPRLYSLIFAMVHNQADTDDLLQETVATAWAKFDEFEPGSDFPAWVAAIARYKVLQHFEHRRRESRFSLDAMNHIADRMTDFTPQADAMHDALDDCLAKLPASDRQLIEMRYREGQTTIAVAAALDRPATTIYSRLNRIYRNLADCITRAVAGK